MENETVEIITDLAGLTDEAIQQAKATNPNVIVTIGVMGSSIAILNPASAAAAIERCTKVNGTPPDKDDMVCIIGFEDVLQTYQLSSV